MNIVIALPGACKERRFAPIGEVVREPATNDRRRLMCDASDKLSTISRLEGSAPGLAMQGVTGRWRVGMGSQ
jgi:hypothetical protein